MVAIPDDVIPNILSRLPVKSLLRFKSVSKSWYSLIKSPNFTKLHLNQTLISNTHRHLISAHSSLSSAHLDADDLKFSELDHPFKNKSEAFGGVKQLGSCNGVVLVSDSRYNVFLFNPCTKSHRKLPPRHIKSPREFTTLYGVGYGNVSDDFKVLKISQLVDPVVLEAYVYSLRQNSWKRVDDIANGVLYQEGMYFMVPMRELKKQMIVWFDVEKENFSTINIPEYENDEAVGSLKLALGDLGGSLCLLAELDRFQKVDLWEMKEYGKRESWTKLSSICTKENIRIGYQIRLIAKSNDGQRVLLKVGGNELYWWDLKGNKAERVQAQGLPGGYGLLFVGFMLKALFRWMQR